jgi:hypothetical protein
MLFGVAVTFAMVATLAAVAGGWAVEANQYGRAAANPASPLFGLALLLPALADRLAKPFVVFGVQSLSAFQLLPHKVETRLLMAAVVRLGVETAVAFV